MRFEMAADFGTAKGDRLFITDIACCLPTTPLFYSLFDYTSPNAYGWNILTTWSNSNDIQNIFVIKYKYKLLRRK